MLCEKYKLALIEAAVTGAVPSPAIRKHVESCALCAAEFARQRSLIAAIDTNLHRQMNAPVPASMLHRLEAHLARQPQPKRTPRFAQIFAGALATLAVAATVVLMLPRQGAKTIDVKQIAPPTHNFVADQSRVDTDPPLEIEKIAPAHRPRLRNVARSTEPEVLVPPDERLGLEQFIANLNGRADLPAVIVKPLQQQPEQGVAGLKTPDIETAALVVQPLQESSTE
jgi:hypothetical protein